jgi:hypothetical protein
MSRTKISRFLRGSLIAAAGCYRVLAEEIDLREIDDFVAAPAEHGFEHEEAESGHLLQRDGRMHGKFLSADADVGQRGAVMSERLCQQWCRLRKRQPRLLFDGRAQGDIARQSNHRYPVPRERGLHRNLQDPRHLLGLGHQLTMVAALREEMFRVSFLKVAADDFRAGNLRRDGLEGAVAHERGRAT